MTADIFCIISHVETHVFYQQVTFLIFYCPCTAGWCAMCIAGQDQAPLRPDLTFVYLGASTFMAPYLYHFSAVVQIMIFCVLFGTNLQ